MVAVAFALRRIRQRGKQNWIVGIFLNCGAKRPLSLGSGRCHSAVHQRSPRQRQITDIVIGFPRIRKANQSRQTRDRVWFLRIFGRHWGTRWGGLWWTPQNAMVRDFSVNNIGAERRGHVTNGAVGLFGVMLRAKSASVAIDTSLSIIRNSLGCRRFVMRIMTTGAGHGSAGLLFADTLGQRLDLADGSQTARLVGENKVV